MEVVQTQRGGTRALRADHHQPRGASQRPASADAEMITLTMAMLRATQGIRAGAPARGRTTRTVIHCRGLQLECLVASDPEGLDSFTPAAPRRTLHPCSDPKSRFTAMDVGLEVALHDRRPAWLTLYTAAGQKAKAQMNYVRSLSI